MILNFTGQPHSGKTTLGKALIKCLNVAEPTAQCFHIDGDHIRELFNNKDYSEAGRRKNIELAYSIAKYLHNQNKNNIIVITLVSPFLDMREDLKKDTDALEFYLKTSQVRGRENFHVVNYETPQENYTFIDTDNDEITCLNSILDIINVKN